MGKELLTQYTVPKYFQQDLFDGLPHQRDVRPPFRWFAFGPARSGSYMHTDPLHTSAWNALLKGIKYWVLFPPGTPGEEAGSQGIQPALQDPTSIGGAVQWFKYVLPQTLSRRWKHARPIRVMQHPGEIIYVPAGWWHTVLNLSDTLCVTQNIAEPVNFEGVWKAVAKGRPD